MPFIKITDTLGLNIDAVLSPLSSLLKYVRELPGLVFQGADIGKLQALTLADAAVRSLSPSLSFERPVSFGTDAPQWVIGADAGVTFRAIPRTPESQLLFLPDDYGDNIEIPASTCYVALGLCGSINSGVQSSSGSLTFGMNASSGFTITSYRPFSLGADPITVAQALVQSIGEFVVPASADDLEALPDGVVVTIDGLGSLKFSGAANLLAIANPLPTVSLPSPAPDLAVTQSGSVRVGGGVGDLHRLPGPRTQNGFAARPAGLVSQARFSVQRDPSASAGVEAGTPALDVLPIVLSAISTDANVDFNELQNVGMSAGQAGSIESAVEAAVSRKLELAVPAEFGSLAENEAAFMYDVASLDDAAKGAIRGALAGDLSSLADAGALPAGISEVRSILSQARARRFTWKVNLLGIFNFGSISQLALRGTVTFSPSTGELVIADQATASRIQTASVNFGADEEKLCHVMAESFLITAAYRGSRAVVEAPTLASSHVFYRLENNASIQDLRRYVAIASALGLSAPPIPEGVTSFGRTSVLVEARYDDAATQALFLAPNGAPRDPATMKRRDGRRWACRSFPTAMTPSVCGPPRMTVCGGK